WPHEDFQLYRTQITPFPGGSRLSFVTCAGLPARTSCGATTWATAVATGGLPLARRGAFDVIVMGAANAPTSFAPGTNLIATIWLWPAGTLKSLVLGNAPAVSKANCPPGGSCTVPVSTEPGSPTFEMRRGWMAVW